MNLIHNVRIKLFSREGRKFYFFIWRLTGSFPGRISLYHRAFTHKSAVSNPHDDAGAYNERLEYLGDAFLSAIVAEYLYKHHPESHEGFLTKIRSRIVSRSSLNRIAQLMNLNPYVQAFTPRPLDQTHVLGDTLEALIGAFYLDKGYRATVRFVVRKIIRQYIDMEELLQEDTNYKSMLIEWGHKNRTTIDFLTDEKHLAGGSSRHYVAEAFVNEVSMGRGVALSKKEAQQKAAAAAFKAVTAGDATIGADA